MYGFFLLSNCSRFHRSLTGDKVNSGIQGCRTGPPAIRAGTTTLFAGVDFIPQSGIYEFGYCSQKAKYMLCSHLGTLFPTMEVMIDCKCTRLDSEPEL
jgi:hypothetical protein